MNTLIKMTLCLTLFCLVCSCANSQEPEETEAIERFVTPLWGGQKRQKAHKRSGLCAF